MDDYGLVSVIIPVYNVKCYLEKALQSVIHQSYKKIEIIIIDDGSTDGSGDICDDFAKMDDRILVIHTYNKGLSSARNIGLRRAKGQFYFFVDSDDWIEMHAIEVLLKTCIWTKSDIVVAQYFIEYTNRTFSYQAGKRKPIIKQGGDILGSFTKGEINDLVWNKLYRASCFEHTLFPEGLRNYEDVATMWKVMNNVAINNGLVAIIPEILFHKRSRKSSISYTRSLRNIEDCWNAFFDKYEGLPDYQFNLLPGCIKAIGRMWLYYCSFSEQERKKASEIIQEMKLFNRKNFNKTIRSYYPFSVKLTSILAFTDFRTVMWLCYFGSIIRMMLRNNIDKPYA